MPHLFNTAPRACVCVRACVLVVYVTLGAFPLLMGGAGLWGLLGYQSYTFVTILLKPWRATLYYTVVTYSINDF